MSQGKGISLGEGGMISHLNSVLSAEAPARALSMSYCIQVASSPLCAQDAQQFGTPVPPSSCTHLSSALLLSMGQKRWRCFWSIPGNTGSTGQSQTTGSFVQRQFREWSGLKFIKILPPSNSSFGYKQEAEVFCHPKSLQNVPAFIAAFIYLFLPLVGNRRVCS